MFGIDEISLTAYALGELSGPERAAIAAHLAGNEEARRYVAEVRATAHMLSDELTRESFGGLSDLQQAAIENQLVEHTLLLPTPRMRRHVRRERWVLAMSIAASVAIVGGVIAALLPFVNRQVQMALKTHDGTEQRPAPGDVPPAGENSATTQPSHPSADVAPGENIASRDLEDEPTAGKPLPPPDDRLVATGSGREEAFPPRDQSPEPRVLQTPQPAPPQRVAVASHADSAGNKPATGAQASPVKPAVPKPGSDAFALLPFDQRSPDKTHPAIPSGSSVSLPPAGMRDAYAHLLENPFVRTSESPISGFSAGVDTASYSNIRRFLNHDKLPPKDAVRIEEMLNYFPVRTPIASDDDEPVTMTTEIGACPWRPDHRLARICMQATDIPEIARPSVNIVFMLDISEAMRTDGTKLPLLKQAMRLMVGKLSARDRVAIVVYGNEAALVMPSTPVENKPAIWAMIDRLDANVPFNGGHGIELAYDTAYKAFIRGGVNRVVLATDGNWHIGITDRSRLSSIIRLKSREGISLTVLGVGMSNLNDASLQKMAEAGNGSYAYIDTLDEAKKVLCDQFSGSLVPMARDLKVEVAFNPAMAESYRLIGYERRALSRDELKSQSRSGGELGAGQSVTALYEIIPAAKSPTTLPSATLTATANYVDPTNNASRMVQSIGEDRGATLPRTSTEFRFAAAVAEFGLMLHDSDYKGNATYSTVLGHALQAAGPDDFGYRQEFIGLIRKAKALAAER